MNSDFLKWQDTSFWRSRYLNTVSLGVIFDIPARQSGIIPQRPLDLGHVLSALISCGPCALNGEAVALETVFQDCKITLSEPGVRIPEQRVQVSEFWILSITTFSLLALFVEARPEHQGHRCDSASISSAQSTHL